MGGYKYNGTTVALTNLDFIAKRRDTLIAWAHGMISSNFSSHHKRETVSQSLVAIIKSTSCIIEIIGLRHPAGIVPSHPTGSTSSESWFLPGPALVRIPFQS
jgi:hypothetical protein